MKELFEKVRSVVTDGSVDIELRVSGEFTTLDEEEILSGSYIVEVRINENNEIVPFASSVRTFVPENSEGEIDPGIAVSEIEELIDTNPYEIIKIEKLSWVSGN